MSKSKYTNLVCAIIICLTILVTVLFMFGNSLGVVAVFSGNVSENAYFSDKDLDSSWSKVSATYIYLGDTVEIDGTGAAYEGGRVYIASSGTYVFSGEQADTQILVSAKDSDVQLVFAGVDIGKMDEPVIYAEDANHVYLTLEDGTENTVSLTEGLSDEAIAEDLDAVIYSKCSLTVNGTGSLTVSAPGMEKTEVSDTETEDGSETGVSSGIEAEDGSEAGDGSEIEAEDGSEVGDGSEIEAEDGSEVGDSSDIKAEDGSEVGDSSDIKAEDGSGTDGGFGIEAEEDSETEGGSGIEAEEDSEAEDSSETEIQKVHGIKSTDDLIITGGIVHVAASGNALAGKDSVRICGGTFDLTSGNDGIKSNNDSDEDKGYILITDGKFSIVSSGDGIQAETDLIVEGGEFDITAGGGSDNAVSVQDDFSGMDPGMDRKDGGMFPDMGTKNRNLPLDVEVENGNLSSDVEAENGNFPSDAGKENGNIPSGTESGNNPYDTDGEDAFSGNSRGNMPDGSRGMKDSQDVEDISEGGLAAGDMSEGDRTAGDMPEVGQTAGDMPEGGLAAGDMSEGNQTIGDLPDADSTEKFPGNDGSSDLKEPPNGGTIADPEGRAEREMSESGNTSGETQNDAETDSYKGLKAGTSITISGGTFDVNCADDGIHSDGTLTIRDGFFVIASGDDGIHADETLLVEGGEVTITTSYEGIEANQITIADGTIDITASDDGINASGGSDMMGVGMGDMQQRVSDNTSPVSDTEPPDIAPLGNTNSAGDEELPGNASLAGDEEPLGNASSAGDEEMSGNVSSAADEEIPGNANASDDTDADAEESTIPVLRITGGIVHINAAGDGLDSNGDLIVEGGLIYIDGPENSGNGALDYGSENGGDCVIYGGIIIALESSGMEEIFSDNSEQTSIHCDVTSGFAEGDELTITDAQGEVLFEYTVNKSGNCVIFSSPELMEGETYTVTVGEQTMEAVAGESSSDVGGGMFRM